MARRKNVKRFDPRYFLHETVNRGEEEREPGVGGQPPEWERKLAKSEPKVARSKRRHVRGLEDPDVDVEELEEALPFMKDVDRAKKGQIPPEQAARIKSATDSQQQGVLAPDDDDFFDQAYWTPERVDALQAKISQAQRKRQKLKEGCPPDEEGGEAIDISAPGMEVHVDDISQLSPEEAFAAGMAAAREAIDQAMGGGEPPPMEE